MIERAYEIMYTSVLIFLGVCIFFALLRAIKGPRIADRIMGINMIGSLAVCAIAILSAHFNQSYLLDVSLVYCMMSSLAVIVLCKIYITVNQKRKKSDREVKKDD
jgi:multicomponent Na+:H+ antiporter subunit F